MNILDTPGHQDFAEDTFRTLTAVDSAIIVIDGAKGVEAQTRKLMTVCRMRKTPVIVFINKMDREGKDPFDLVDEVESELQISVRPLSWPINQGQRFKGVYNIYEQNLNLFTPDKQMVTEKVAVDIASQDLDERVGAEDAAKLRDDLELIDGVYPEFDVNTYLEGLPDNGIFKIGDTLTEGEQLHFKGLPSFSPEMFKYIENADPMKTEAAGERYQPADGRRCGTAVCQPVQRSQNHRHRGPAAV